ncbi:MAG: hypothetical protein LBM67_09360 [Lentimicrobiaceae bacterium]|jgi:predicted PurR-regulated permease PerM|nr:hypothetical protein [Lentimicrobiaceae bacterium]
MKRNDCNQLKNQFKRYVSLRTYHAGLIFNKYVSEVVSTVIKNIVFGTVAAMFLLMLSLAFVFWYGEAVGKLYHGFLILSAIYILIGLIIYLFRNQLFRNPLIKKIHKKDVLEKESFLSRLPAPNNINDLNQQIQLVKFQIEENEQALQNQFDDLIDTIEPLIDFGKRVGNMFSMATVIYKITVEAVQNFLDKIGHKKSAEADYDDE